MTKPKGSRKTDVESKIAYARHRHQEIMTVLFDAKKNSSDPDFLVHTCADIISTVRECFDYLGQDIIDGCIIPATTNTRILQDHVAGKLKSYFPFYGAQVSKPRTVYYELLSIQPALHQDLLTFTDSIARGVRIPGTLFTYKLILDVKDMVNEKKHDKLIAIVSDVDREYLIESEHIKMILPIRDQKGWSSFAVQPGTLVSRVAEYRFAHNDQEVSKFCLFATNATDRVIADFYCKYFA
jgi:hypothetical protein